MQKTFIIHVYDEDQTRRGKDVFAYGVEIKNGGSLALGYGVSEADCVNVAANQIKKYLRKEAKKSLTLRPRAVSSGS